MNWEECTGSLEEGERLGLDIGSRSTKFCSKAGTGIMDTSDFIFRSLSEQIPNGVDVVTTGYGRNKVETGRSIPEIRAHTVGVLRTLDIPDLTILDIGGQDFKVIRVEGKAIRDFHMNDKCAAGTGRFLEKMADALGMTITELGSYTGGRKILESTCSVFTETELISLMMEGASRGELAGGVIHSVFERIRPYLRMFPLDTLVFTGGVSRCAGLGETLSEELSVELVVPRDSQLMGAVGCFHS